MKRTIEQIVDLRCRFHDHQQQQEKARAERAKALQQNKQDVTATPPAQKPGKTLRFTLKRA